MKNCDNCPIRDNCYKTWGLCPLHESTLFSSNLDDDETDLGRAFEDDFVETNY